MERIKVGLVGVSRGSGTVKPFAYYPETEITALCDLDQDTLNLCAEHFQVPLSQCFTDYDAFLEAGINAVIVGTPIQLHAEQVLKALDKGLHVLSEVTMAYTVTDCQKIVDKVRETGKIYMLGENCCYWPFIRAWNDWIRAGKIGSVYYAEAEYIHNIQELLVNESNGETFWRLTRPPIYYCSHSLGPLLMIMDDRITAVSCLDAGYSTMPNHGEGCLNMEVALFKTQKGAIIKLLRSQVAHREPPLHFYCLYGTDGVIESDRRSTTEHTTGGARGLLHQKDKHYWKHLQPDHQFPYDEIYTGEVDQNAPEEFHKFEGSHGTSEFYLARDFIDAILTGAQPFLSAPFGANITIPGIIAHESAKQGGKWLDVPVLE